MAYQEQEQVIADLSEVSIDLKVKTNEVPRSGLLALLKTEKYADVSFMVEGKVLKAHRVVVASQSSYFDRLLYGSMKESGCDEIVLHETPWRAFTLVLDYLYSGCVGSTDLQTALDLLALSDQYGLDGLRQSIEEVLCKHIELDYVLQFMCYADMHNASKLYKQCSEYVDYNARSILHSHGMMILPKAHLKSLLKRDSFFASEIEIFEAVKRWKDYNGLDAADMEDIMKCIRLSEIPAEELEGVVYPSGLVKESVIEQALQRNRGTSFLNKSRGKVGMNLFESPSTTLKECSNFRVSIVPDMFGKVDVELPCHLEFTLSSHASQNLSFIHFEFDDIYVINHVKFDGRPLTWESSIENAEYDHEIKNPYSYILQVSRDGANWSTVIDHSIYKCYFTQDLYFPNIATKFLRLTIMKAEKYLKLRVFNSSQVKCDIPLNLYSGGGIGPLKEITPKCIEHWNKKEDLRCMLTFHQPYHISRLRLQFGGVTRDPDHFGQLKVSVALYNKSCNYREACTVIHNLGDELIVSFKERLVCIVSIRFATYFNGKTGEDLMKMLLGRKLEILAFKVCLGDTHNH